MLTSRERILRSINHKVTDRVPLDIGGTPASGIAIETYIALKKKLGLKVNNIRIYDIFCMMAQIGKDMIDTLGIDTLLIPALCPRFNIPISNWKSWKMRNGFIVKTPLEFNTVEDDDNSLLLIVEGKIVGKMPKEGHYFSEILNSTMGNIESIIDPPDPDEVEFSLLSKEDLLFRKKTAKKFYQTTDKALIIDIGDNLRWNTSIPNWLYAIASDPKKCYMLHKKKSLNLLKKIQQLADAVGPYIDVFAIYQDLGTQRGPLISPKSFETLIAPHYKKIFDWIHKQTKWKVLFHSCGSIYQFIPKMIEMGVDILNPVQCAASEMGPEKLKSEFGKKIVFWGGGIDTQTVLPMGSVDEVKKQVTERISILGRGGGFVFAPTQDIQAEVPTENILAMTETVHSIKFN